MLITLSKLRASKATYDFRTLKLEERTPFFVLPAMMATVDRVIALKVPRVSERLF